MPPPSITNVYPCLDWVPQGSARPNPQRLRLTRDELKNVITAAKARALKARQKLGQTVRHEQQQQQAHSSNHQDVTTTTNRDNANQQLVDDADDDDDDVIMREYGLEGYDDEDRETGDNISENDDENDDPTGTRGPPIRELAEDIGNLTYHASNDEDPYLDRQGGADIDDDEDDEDLLIKPTDNLIIAGHVSKEESSIEVYVYDSETKRCYLHHDIMQSDYPCCVRWIGHARNQTKNLAVAGYMNPEIYIWDLDVVDVLEPMEILSGHKDAVIDIDWNRQVKNILASGSADSHIRLWNLDECKSVSNIKMNGKVSALQFGIFENFMLLAGDLSKNVSLIDTRTNSVTLNWKLTGEIERVKWMPVDHSKFLVSDEHGYIHYFDTRNPNDGQALLKFRAHQISVTGLEFSPKCDHMLVTASADEGVKVWDTRSAFKSTTGPGNQPTLVKEISDLNVGNILSLRMCPNNFAMVAVGGDSKTNSFKTHDLTKDQEIRDTFMG